MVDVEVVLEDRPGALAELGETLGRAGVSLEGGGMFGAVAHYLVDDGEAARTALEAAGIEVVAVREVLVVPLPADVPGQLGLIARRLADEGVSIEVQYSDHDNRKVLVVDDLERGRAAVASL